MKQLLLACVLACAATAAAQATTVATLQGTVSDPIHHRAIAGADIALDSPRGVLRTRTNDRGQFAFVGVPAGPVGVTIDADGYSRLTIATCVLPGEARGMSVFIVPQVSAISNPSAEQTYYDRANVHDNQVASAPHFAVTTDEYGVGFCSD
jgi:hypothetical protein